MLMFNIAVAAVGAQQPEPPPPPMAANPNVTPPPKPEQPLTDAAAIEQAVADLKPGEQVEFDHSSPDYKKTDK